jgi:hypothetical protein
MLHRDDVEIHFFIYKDLDALTNDGMCYIRLQNIQAFYDEVKAQIEVGKAPQKMPWGQTEFSITDPDHNCLTFGEGFTLKDL